MIDDPQHLICIVEPAGGVCTRCVIPSSGGTKLGIWKLSLSVDLEDGTQTSTARSRGLEKVKLDRHMRHRLFRSHRQLLGLPRSHHPFGSQKIWFNVILSTGALLVLGTERGHGHARRLALEKKSTLTSSQSDAMVKSVGSDGSQHHPTGTVK